MRQVSFIAASMGLVLFLGGCSGAEGGDVVSQETPPASSEASPTASPSPASPTSPNRARPNRPRGIMPSDLINSTNPDQRLRSIQSARPDPFALLGTAPAVTITREVQSGGQTSASGGGAGGGGMGSSGSGSSSSGRSSARTPGSTQALLPQAIPALPDIPRLPRPMPNALEPQPELARAVSVSGVVQIGNIVYAIVDAPDEPSSRYVQVGQRLSNGEILVRRIDFNGSDSSVILEQSGMQVVRQVGDAPVLPTPPVAPGASAQPATAT